jgi:hypothetical protein
MDSHRDAAELKRAFPGKTVAGRRGTETDEESRAALQIYSGDIELHFA